jgi:hypothetical protein
VYLIILRKTIPQPSLTPHLKRDINMGKGDCNIILLVRKVKNYRALFYPISDITEISQSLPLPSTQKLCFPKSAFSA